MLSTCPQLSSPPSMGYFLLEQMSRVGKGGSRVGHPSGRVTWMPRGGRFHVDAFTCIVRQAGKLRLGKLINLLKSHSW